MRKAFTGGRAATALAKYGRGVKVDNTGVGELVSVYITTRNNHRKLKLMYLNDRIRELFDVVKLLHVFDDEAEAVRSF